MSRFFKNAAFPILIVVVLAFFAQHLISPGTSKPKPNYGQFLTQVENGEVKSVTIKTRDNTVDAWQSWSALHQTYDGPWADLVHHSGRVLQGLSFQPSGAIVAAATTSLPEGVGGERNWDYRYAWVRDASFTMEALWVAACPDEADDFFAFMTTAAASAVGPGRSLQIMFGIGGEHDLTERELPHLEGWCDSRPVRVGNGAWDQAQIDVYGEILGAAHRLAEQLGAMDEQTKAFLVPARTPPPSAGSRRTKASGRSAVTRSTSCTRRSCAGWRWTARSRSRRPWVPRTRSRAGPRPGTRSTAPSCRTAER